MCVFMFVFVFVFVSDCMWVCLLCQPAIVLSGHLPSGVLCVGGVAGTHGVQGGVVRGSTCRTEKCYTDYEIWNKVTLYEDQQHKIL